MMKRKLRVLILAEAANPEWASVPLVGWSLYAALAKVTDAHLVTHIRNRDSLARAGLVEGRDFTTIDNELVARPLDLFMSRIGMKLGGWTLGAVVSAVSYYLFEHRACFAERVIRIHLTKNVRNEGSRFVGKQLLHSEAVA